MCENQQLKPSETISELDKLEKAIENFLQVVGPNIENVIRVEGDPNETFLRNQFHSITSKVESSLSDIKHLKREVSAEGILYLNEHGRYEINERDYLKSGSICEILIEDVFDGSRWVKTLIDHDSNYGYFATALGREFCIDGLLARVRRNKFPEKKGFIVPKDVKFKNELYKKLRIPENKITLEKPDVSGLNPFQFFLRKESREFVQVVSIEDYPVCKLLSVRYPFPPIADNSEQIVLTDELLNDFLEQGFKWYHNSEMDTLW